MTDTITSTDATVKALNDLAEKVSGPLRPPDPTTEPTTTGVQPVHIDGLLYIGIGALTVLIAALQSDKAALAMSPLHLWGAQTVAETINGGLLALKMFRSTSYADSRP